MNFLNIVTALILLPTSFAMAETRQELDTRTRSHLLGLQGPVVNGSNARSGAGFSVEKSMKTDACDCGLNNPTGQLQNSLRVALSCSDETAPLPIPARFKKVSWSITETNSSAASSSGVAQTDNNGIVMINLSSTRKDLGENHFELRIGDAKVKVTAGQGPYSFDSLPYKICSHTNAE
jgi:hypothetical protein